MKRIITYKPLIKKIFLINILFLISYCSVFSQTKKELLEYGDEAFKNGNYTSSAYFYGRITGSYSSGEKERIYPYQLMQWNQPLPKSKGQDIDTLDSSSDSTTYTFAEKLKLFFKVGVETFRDISLSPDNYDAGILSVDSLSSDSGRTKLFRKNKTYQHALYRLAESYRLSYDYEKAGIFYGQCLENDPVAFPLVHFWYGYILKRNMEYGTALFEFNTFLNIYSDSIPSDTIQSYLQSAKLESDGCSFAAGWINNPRKGVKITEADSVLNAGSSNFAATYFLNDSSVLFTSARPTSIQKRKENETAWYCDIYKSTKEKGRWTNPKNFGGPVNTLTHEGTPCMNPDKRNLFFTRWSGTREKGVRVIYMSKFFNNQWLQPMKLNEEINMPGYHSMQPAFIEDENILLFVSDRPGGYGKMDIWYCTVDEYGNTGEIMNLNPVINTSEDDVSPFYHDSSQTLFFSSDGHVGMGGLDIFTAEGTIDNWSEPNNLGFPINSSKDDTYFVLDNTLKNGFLSSDRKGCDECDDGGNCYHIYKVEYAPVKFILSGHVYSKEMKQVMPNALITFKDILENIEPFFIISDKNGHYSTPLRSNMTYYIKAQKVRHFADAGTITTMGLDTTTYLVLDFYLPRIPIGEIEIKGIYYDYDKWDLRSESRITLDSLVWFLNVNDNMTIELSSHTDERGKDNYNLELSQKRAQSVVDYLIKKGVDSERFTPVGYGKTKPIIKNAKTEEEHQQNRRTAFSILTEDYVSKKK
ncbi:MAG: OmpA family protein [Bacteroidota bacterium]